VTRRRGAATVLAGTVLAGTVLAGTVLAGTVLGEIMPASRAASADRPSEAPPSSAWSPSASGDRELAARVLEENGAATAPGRIGVGTYARDLYTRIRAAAANWTRNLLENAEGLGRGIAFVAKAFVWAAAAALLILLLTFLFRLSRRLTARSGEEAREEPAGIPAPPPAPMDAGGWRRRLEELLEAGRLEEALEALWWWLARSLAGPAADPSWTSRELLRRARRRDLAGLLQRLDAYQYGPRRPSSGQVQVLVRELTETLAGPTAEAAP
jgi:hypothetical protein